MSPDDFPVLFTVNRSNKHDVILVNAALSIPDLQRRIQSMMETSPNCAEPFAQYAKPSSGGTRRVRGLRVRWSGEPREARLWPGVGTIFTEENVEAVLRLVEVHGGKDVLEVEVEAEVEAEERQAAEL